MTQVRDLCLAADVPFFLKQWGGVRKKHAGRLLEGRTWDEMPFSAAGAGHFGAGLEQMRYQQQVVQIQDFIVIHHMGKMAQQGDFNFGIRQQHRSFIHLDCKRCIAA